MRIAFCGSPGAGKSEAARYLAERYGFQRVSFAGALREVAQLRVGYDWRSVLIEWVYGRLPKLIGNDKTFSVGLALAEVMERFEWKPGEKNRAYLQALGQAGRSVVPDLWIRLALDQLPDACAFDDLRYPNELAALQAAGFAIYRIDAPEALRLERMQKRDGKVDMAALGAPVEHALDGVTLPAFDNSAGLQALYGWLEGCLNEASHNCSDSPPSRAHNCITP